MKISSARSFDIVSTESLKNNSNKSFAFNPSTASVEIPTMESGVLFDRIKVSNSKYTFQFSSETLKSNFFLVLDINLYLICAPLMKPADTPSKLVIVLLM